MAQCTTCDMEMKDGENCACKETVCHYCCECGEGCSCGCSEKE